MAYYYRSSQYETCFTGSYSYQSWPNGYAARHTYATPHARTTYTRAVQYGPVSPHFQPAVYAPYAVAPRMQYVCTPVHLYNHPLPRLPPPTLIPQNAPADPQLQQRVPPAQGNIPWRDVAQEQLEQGTQAVPQPQPLLAAPAAAAPIARLQTQQRRARVVQPLLANRPGTFPFLNWIVTYNPAQHEHAVVAVARYVERVFPQFRTALATLPPLRRMAIRIGDNVGMARFQEAWGSIYVEAEEGAGDGITVERVLQGIYEYFRRPLDPGRPRGRLRADELEGRTRFAGIQHAGGGTPEWPNFTLTLEVAGPQMGNELYA